MRSDRKKRISRTGRFVSGFATSALFLSVLTAIFFLQGRALREGWLHHFGLESAQFPITAADTYWLAFNGWLNTAIGWFNGAWDLYTTQLAVLIVPMVILAFAGLAWEWLKSRPQIQGAATSGSSDAAPDEGEAGWLSANTWQSWMVRVLISIAVAPISLAVLPLALFVGGLVFVFAIVTLVGPFEDLGRESAARFCSRSVESAARIVMADGYGSPDWGYRVECGSNFCAMVRDGKLYVVPVDGIQRIDLPPPGASTSATRESSGNQLCATESKSPGA